MLVRFLSVFILYFFAFLASANADQHILIFGNTIRAAHAKIIPVAGKALANFLQQNGFKSSFTQEASFLNDSNLKSFSEVILLDTSEGILNLDQKKSIETYFQNGGGILAVHSSIALGNDWPWFKSLVGASFKSHPPIHSEEVVITTPPHASVLNNDLSWKQKDEWYEFVSELDPTVTIVATVQAKPISWCRDGKTQGRFWYTAMGHSEELYSGSNPSFLKHLLGAATWALRK